MPGTSRPVRLIASWFPTLPGRIIAALALLLAAHLTGSLLLTAALILPELQLLLGAVAALALLFALAAGWLFGRSLRHGFSAIDRDIRSLFATVDKREMDLFLAETKEESETGGVARKGYADFLAKIRTLVEEIRRMGITIAVDTARVSSSVAATSDKAQRQQEISQQVSFASSESSRAITEVSASAQYVASKTQENLGMAKDSYQELVAVTEKISQISQSVEIFRATVADLSRSSASILGVVSTINDIAEKTNLLSLNATIEAARAGEHGKGFAVVAEEVRELARRVKPATAEISENINSMIAIVNRTEQGTAEISHNTGETSLVINTASTNFRQMIADFEETNGQLLKIAAAIEELSSSNREVTEKIAGINSLCREIAGAMESSHSSVEALSEVTEGMLELVSRFRTGSGTFDRLLSWAQKGKEEIEAEIEKMRQDGSNVFDTSYRQIANTNPQKFETSYTSHFQKTMQPLFDRLKESMAGAIYTVTVDRNGYLPAHHSAFSQKMTGNPEHDLIHSRHMRIFRNNKTEKRRCSHTQPMLLQTYMRDTGEVLNDLSLPIFVGGKHWGAFIIGFDPKNFR
jgi:methyl-accepting chemotaxis protein